MATQIDPPPLDIREQLARIDKHLAEIEKIKVDTKFVPWQFAVGGITGGAALFAVGAAFMKLFL